MEVILWAGSSKFSFQKYSIDTLVRWRRLLARDHLWGRSWGEAGTPPDRSHSGRVWVRVLPLTSCMALGDSLALWSLCCHTWRTPILQVVRKVK